MVISRDIFNDRSGTVIALMITSQVPAASLPLAWKVESVVTPKPSWVKISQIRTLSTEWLGRRPGRVSVDELQQIVGGLFDLVA